MISIGDRGKMISIGNRDKMISICVKEARC